MTFTFGVDLTIATPEDAVPVQVNRKRARKQALCPAPVQDDVCIV